MILPSDLVKMRLCSPLLPPPGDEVVVVLIGEVERLRGVMRETYETIEAGWGDGPDMGKVKRLLGQELLVEGYAGYKPNYS